MGEEVPEIVTRQRIDKWLFFARMAKSRSLAQTFIGSGRVKVNGSRIAQPSVNIKPGDMIEITLDRRDIVLKVLDGGSRRGPYEEARKLYEDLSPPPPPRDELTPFEIATRAPGAGRPEKKERRAIEKLRGRMPGE